MLNIIIFIIALSVSSYFPLVFAANNFQNDLISLPKISVLVIGLTKVDFGCSVNFLSHLIPIDSHSRDFKLPIEPNMAFLNKILFILNSDKHKLKVLMQTTKPCDCYNKSSPKIFESVQVQL